MSELKLQRCHTEGSTDYHIVTAGNPNHKRCAIDKHWTIELSGNKRGGDMPAFISSDRQAAGQSAADFLAKKFADRPEFASETPEDKQAAGVICAMAYLKKIDEGQTFAEVQARSQREAQKSFFRKISDLADNYLSKFE